MTFWWYKQDRFPKMQGGVRIIVRSCQVKSFIIRTLLPVGVAGSRDTSRSLFLDCLDGAAVLEAYKTIHKIQFLGSINNEQYLSLVMV